MEFDYIIVGAGSAGCAVASRLSARCANSVLLIEAGPPDTSPFIHMPKGFVKLLANSAHCWVIPHARRYGSGSQQEIWIGGKMFGGSNSINGMQYNRGQPRDYDDWEAQGAGGWGWSAVGPAFKAMEDHELGEAEDRGVGGPIHLQVNRSRLALHDALIEAGAQMGLRHVEDLNAAGSDEGIGYAVWNIYRGRRWGTAQSLLAAARSRPNLKVLAQTAASQIRFDGRRAVTVECVCNGQTQTFRARREIVLCAGVIHSPKLLQLSGVGPASHLQSLGIPVVADSPGVGRNLRDHRYLPVQFRLKSHDFSSNREYKGWRLVKNLLQYSSFHTGPLTWAPAEIAAFIKTRPDLHRADAHLVMQSFSWSRSPGGTRLTLEDKPGFGMIAGITHSESTGTILIRSSDPAELPAIDYQPLSHEADRRIAPCLLRYVRRFCEQPALRSTLAAEIFPGLKVQSDDEIVAAFIDHGASGLHMVGSCRMGQGLHTVVDERLRVHGFPNLRVADCSIMPACISGSGGTSAPAMMIGWRAAQLIGDDAIRTP
jgi:choline dehydrogenase-like flavoprotein